MRSQPATISAVCHSGFSLPDQPTSPAKLGSAAFFPASSGNKRLFAPKCDAPLRSSVSVPSSRPLNSTATCFSGMLEGSHTLLWFTTPAFWVKLSPFDAPAAPAIFLAFVPREPPFCLQPRTWQRAGPLKPSKVSYLNVIVGNCEANVVVVASHFVVGGAANRKDTFYSQLVH